MTQYLDRACPKCHKSLRVRSQYLGKYVVCKQCSASFKVQPEDPPSEQDLRPRLAALEEDLRRARADLEEAQRQQLQLASDRERVVSELNREKVRLGEALAERQRAGAELDNLRQELQAAQTQVATLALRHEEAEVEARRLLAEAVAEIQRARAEAVEHREVGDSARAEVSDLSARLERESAEARQRHARMEVELSRALGEVEQLRSELRDAHQAQQERDQSEAEERAAREAEVGETLRQHLEDATRADAALAHMREQRDRLDVELREALARLEVATRADNERDRLIAEREAARVKVTEVTGRWQAEAERADQAVARNEALTRELAEARKIHEESSARQADEVQALRAEISATTDRLVLEAEAHANALRLAEAERDLARAELREDAEQFRVALENARAAEVQQVSRQVALSRASFEEERVRWQAEADARSQQYEGALRENHLRQEEERRNWQAQLARYLQDLEDVRREHQGAVAEGQGLSAAVASLKAQLELAKGREAELMEAERAARAELAQSREEIAAAGAKPDADSQADRTGFAQMLALAQWEADQQRRALEADLAESRQELAMLRNILQGMGVRV